MNDCHFIYPLSIIHHPSIAGIIQMVFSSLKDDEFDDEEGQRLQEEVQTDSNSDICIDYIHDFCRSNAKLLSKLMLAWSLGIIIILSIVITLDDVASIPPLRFQIYVTCTSIMAMFRLLLWKDQTYIVFHRKRVTVMVMMVSLCMQFSNSFFLLSITQQ